MVEGQKSPLELLRSQAAITTTTYADTVSIFQSMDEHIVVMLKVGGQEGVSVGILTMERTLAVQIVKGLVALIGDDAVLIPLPRGEE
jgi:hypothetical protein